MEINNLLGNPHINIEAEKHHNIGRNERRDNTQSMAVVPLGQINHSRGREKVVSTN